MSGGSLDQNVGKIAQSKDTVAEQILKGGSESALSEVHAVPKDQQKSMIDTMTGAKDQVPKNFVGTKDVSIAEAQKPGDTAAQSKEQKPAEQQEEGKVVTVDIPVVSTVGSDTKISGRELPKEKTEAVEEPKSQSPADVPQTEAVRQASEAQPGSASEKDANSGKPEATSDNKTPLDALDSFIAEALKTKPGSTVNENTVEQVTKPK